MARMGRPKSGDSKKKILSIRVADSLYQQISDYAKEHNKTVTEIVLQELEKRFSNSK